MIGFVRLALVVALAAAATILANFVLLGVALGPHDPVGRLSPRATVSSPGPAAGRAPHPIPPADDARGEGQDD